MKVHHITHTPRKYVEKRRYRKVECSKCEAMHETDFLVKKCLRCKALLRIKKEKQSAKVTK